MLIMVFYLSMVCPGNVKAVNREIPAIRIKVIKNEVISNWVSLNDRLG